MKLIGDLGRTRMMMNGWRSLRLVLGERGLGRGSGRDGGKFGKIWIGRVEEVW